MGKKIYHIKLFIFGLIYYLIIPAIVVGSAVWVDFPGMQSIDQFYESRYMPGYLAYVFFLGLFFVIGSKVPLLLKKKIVRDRTEYRVNTKRLCVITLPFLLYVEYVIFTNRGSLFQGYLVELDSPIVGVIATATVFFLFFFLYNKLGKNIKKVNIYLGFVLVEFALVLIGLGSRMYVLIIFVSILLYMVDNGIISIKKLYFCLLAGVLLLLSVGIWRIGGSDLSFDGLLFIGVAEPVYTWISAISLYDLNELPLVAFPFNFISTVVNFIPSAFLPNKEAFLAAIPLEFENPQGAISLVVSLIANFGILGSLTAIFVLGYLLTFIRLHWNTVFGRAYYYCVCGIIPFQLFRDPIEIVNKEFFWNLLILPGIIFLLYRILYSSKLKKSHELFEQNQI